MEERHVFSFTLSPLRIFCAVFLFLCFLVAYIVQVNASSTKAYALRDAQRYQEELLRTNDRLTAEIDRLRSLSSIMERYVFLDLVPVQNISYVLPDEGDELAMP